MRTKSRSRGRELVLAVLTLVVSMPELARAQQSGLFPLGPIKRQRVPCDQEDPVYKIYKEKYFGYHPPCWRPFPAGWGCPSPEKPDVEKAFREQKLSTYDNLQPGPGEEMEGRDQDLGRPPIPDIRDGRSPFDPAPGQPGARPGNPAAPGPARNPASPFDLDTPDNQPGAATPRASRSRPAAPPGGEGGPALSAPEDSTGVSGARTSRFTRDEATDPQQGDGVLLAQPANTVPPDSAPGAPSNSQPAQTSLATSDDTPVQTNPAGSPPRRGFLSGLFNNLGWNWTRR